MLLFTLHDLYKIFVKDYNGIKTLLKFSFFTSLKPKECICTGDSGTHTICVCMKHENIKLKLTTLTKNVDYRNLSRGAVCDTDDINCMLQWWNKNPKINGEKRLYDEFKIQLPPDNVWAIGFWRRSSFVDKSFWKCACIFV